jgi:hypothetical protein
MLYRALAKLFKSVNAKGYILCIYKSIRPLDNRTYAAKFLALPPLVYLETYSVLYL